MEVFSELRSKKIAAAQAVAPSHNSMTSNHPVSASSAAQIPAESIFASPDDRQLLLAILLHCADIGNSVMPYSIAERCLQYSLCDLMTETLECHQMPASIGRAMWIHYFCQIACQEGMIVGLGLWHLTRHLMYCASHIISTRNSKITGIRSPFGTRQW